MSDSAQMVIANRLRDGLTVFRTAEGSWSESIAEGHLAMEPVPISPERHGSALWAKIPRRSGVWKVDFSGELQ